MTTIEPSISEQRLLRAAAQRRSWICPGAGFALTGHRLLGLATFFLSLAVVPAMAWFTFQPTRNSIFSALSILVLSSVLCLFEQYAVLKIGLYPSSPIWLTKRSIPLGVVLYLAILLSFALCYTTFGSLRMAGSGMSPTLVAGQRLAYYKCIDWNRVQSGKLLVFRNSVDSGWGEPGWIILARILAVPGDTLSIEDGRYLVNGNLGPPTPPLKNYAAVVEIPPSPASIVVPADCYFIVQDNATGSLDSRVLSWVRKDQILGSRLWLLTLSHGVQPMD